MLHGTIAWLAQGLSETSILTLFRTFLFWGLHTSLVLSRNFSGLHLVAWRWCEVNSWAHIPRLFTRPNAKHVHWLWALSQRWKAEKNVVLISEQQLCQGQLRYVFLNSVWSINIYYTSAFPPLFFLERLGLPSSLASVHCSPEWTFRGVFLFHLCTRKQTVHRKSLSSCWFQWNKIIQFCACSESSN